MPFLSFLKSESEGQSSDPVAATAPSSEEHPLPKSLDEDGDADAVTKAIGTSRAKILFLFSVTFRVLLLWPIKIYCGRPAQHLYLLW